MAEIQRVATKRRALLALFDSIKQIEHLVAPTDLTPVQRQDFAMARSFLQAYNGSVGTFNSYRRDVERLLFQAMSRFRITQLSNSTTADLRVGVDRR